MAPRLPTLFLLLLIAGCDRRSESDTATVRAEAPAASDSSIALDHPTAWFARARTLDIDGNGLLDTIRLVATGDPDHDLGITLTALIGDNRVALAQWTAEGELIDPPAGAREPGPIRRAYLTRSLEHVLASVSTRPFRDSTLTRPLTDYVVTDDCSEYVHECIVAQLRASEHPGKTPEEQRTLPYDTARAAAVVRELSSATVSLSFSYGYESSYVVVWSPRLRRFLTVSACC